MDHLADVDCARRRLPGAFCRKRYVLHDQPVITGMGWTDDFSPVMVKTIGLLEVLAAVGLILPAVLGIVPALVSLAALGLVGLMAGAAITHARRKETPMMAINVVLLALALVVAWGRFGPYAFTS